MYAHLGSGLDEAICNLNIGNALVGLGKSEQAIEYYERAKTVYAHLGLKRQVSSCELAIGNALRVLGQPQQAIEYLERAKMVFAELDRVLAIAHCNTNIGVAFEALAQHQQAIEHYEQAKTLYGELGYEREIAICNSNIGIALTHLATVAEPELTRSKYQQALEYLDRAISTFEKLRTFISVTAYRISFFEQFINSYRVAIQCCIHLGQITEALHYFERSRSKTLAEAVIGNLIPDSSEIIEDLYREFFRLRSQLHEAGFLPLIGTDSNAQARSDGRERGAPSNTESEFNALVERIVRQFPASAFAQRLKAAEVRYLKDVTEYVALLPNHRSCLLEFLSWADDGKLRAFLVTKQNGLELLTFPEDSLNQLDAVSGQWTGVYDGTLRPREKAAIVENTCHRLHDVIFNAQVKITREASDEPAPIEESRKLLDHLSATLAPGDEEQPRHMYLIPHRSLFLLPLHAACWDDPQAGETEPTSATNQQKTRLHYLLEDYVIIYAPSAYLLKVSQERQYPKPQQLRAMVVGNPLPLKDTPSLAFAVDEAHKVTEQLQGAGWQVDELTETEATKQRFLHGDPQGVAGINSGVYDHLHQAQHAGMSEQGHQVYFCFGQSSEDHQCYDRDIAGAPLQRMQSVVAAACLTSVTSPTLNEYLGMGAAFLQAGVGTFIGTIFPLSDAGSSQLVPALYRLHLEEGLSWADALRRAQLQMAGVAVSSVSRDNRKPTTTAKDIESLQPEIPLDHPYHWAAFTISGKE